MSVYQPVRTLARGLAVLRACNDLGHPTVDAVARRTGLDWSTTLRLLETLAHEGYVHRNQSARTFTPTLQARALGEGFGREAWATEFAAPAIKELSRRMIWPVDLMVFQDDAMLIVETTHRMSPLSIDRNMIGRRLPVLQTSAGRVYLAHVSEASRAEILRRLAAQPGEDGRLARDHRAIEAMVTATRARGYGLREGGLFPHTKSIAVPILHGDTVLACISIIWIASAVSIPDAVERFLAPLVETARAIEAAIAGSDP